MGRFQCFKCGKTFMSRHTLKNHVKKSICRPVTCPKCNRVFSAKGLARHLQKTENCENLKCFCGKQFKFPNQLKEHTLTHSNDKKFECLDCKKVFKTERILGRHFNSDGHKLIINGHAIKPVKKLDNQANRNNFLKKRIKEPKRTCPNCSKAVGSRYFKNHLARCSRKPITCLKCKRRFVTLAGYNYHQNVCGKKCEFCGKTNFGCISKLKHHETVCPWNSKRTCKHCKAKFADINLKDIHVRTFCEHREFIYKCPFCKNEDAFDSTDANQTLKHIMICQPNQIGRVKCYFCDHWFDSKHLAIHAQRELLGTRFFDQNQLTFKCKDCDFLKFPTQELLDDHNNAMFNATVLVPDATPIYKCIRCEIEMGTQRDMDLHSSKVHGVVIPFDNIGDLRTISSKNKDTEKANNILKDKFPNYTCYLCNAPLYCKVANKYHIKKCQKTYTVQSPQNMPPCTTTTQEEILADHGIISGVDIKTRSAKFKRKLTPSLIHKILRKITEDIEDSFFKEYVGSHFHVELIAIQVQMVQTELRECLGLSQVRCNPSNDPRKKGQEKENRIPNMSEVTLTNYDKKTEQEDANSIWVRLPKCKKCYRRFETISDCQQHEKNCTAGRFCELCGKRFPYASRLRGHLISHERKTIRI